jgi:hypothetical protein
MKLNIKDRALIWAVDFVVFVAALVAWYQLN